MTVMARDHHSKGWVTPRVGKWSHGLRGVRSINAAVGHGARTWYVTLSDQVISNYRPTGRIAFVGEAPPKPECPRCARRQLDAR
jgi:hypothetical protein